MRIVSQTIIRYDDITISMEIKGFDHIHFFVTDINKAIEFYQGIGFELVRKFIHGGRESAQMKVGGIFVDLNLTKAADNPGYSHFSLKVDDLDEAADSLRERGWYFDGPLDVAETRRRIITLRDPNGFLVQLVESR
jgi:catechol 2,3-dioxygenase-like lactoylglutathione lyase family enzyme